MTAGVKDDRTIAPDDPPPVGAVGASARFVRQRERILDAATALLNQKGVWGMTLQEVAAALDLKTSSVTYYFRRREQLAAAVFENSLSRLAAIAESAGCEATPRARIGRYVELFVRQFACALRNEVRPFAILSEIRAMDEPTRSALIKQYQGVFRTVRAFFGPADTEARKRLNTARTHILNEALFWAEVWLPRFAIGDLPNVQRRLIDVLADGLAARGTEWSAASALPRLAPAASDQEAFLRTATRLINDFGYKGASINRIASELHRAKTTFYRHIDGKDDLVAECSRDSHRRLADLRRSAADASGSAWEHCATTLRRALGLQFIGEYPLLRSSALQAMPMSIRETAVERSERTALGLMDLLIGAMQEGTARIVDPLIASHVVMSAIDAFYDLKGWRRDMASDEAIEVYMSVLANGVIDAGA